MHKCIGMCSKGRTGQEREHVCPCRDPKPKCVPREEWVSWEKMCCPFSWVWSFYLQRMRYCLVMWLWRSWLAFVILTCYSQESCTLLLVNALDLSLLFWVNLGLLALPWQMSLLVFDLMASSLAHQTTQVCLCSWDSFAFRVFLQDLHLTSSLVIMVIMYRLTVWLDAESLNFSTYSVYLRPSSPLDELEIKTFKLNIHSGRNLIFPLVLPQFSLWLFKTWTITLVSWFPAPE